MKSSARFSWLAPFVRRYRRALIAALALGFATAVFSCGLMATSGYLIAGSAVVETVLMLNVSLMLVRLFGVGKPLLRYAERLASHDWVLRMVSGMRAHLYRALEAHDGKRSAQQAHSAQQDRSAQQAHSASAAFSPSSSFRLGDALGLFANDIEQLQNLYLRVAFPCIIAWILAGAAVVLMGIFDLWAACFLALALVVIVAVAPLVSLLCSRAREARLSALKQRMYASTTDDILGASDWAYAGRGQQRAHSYAKHTNELHELMLAARRFERWRDCAVHVVSALLVVAVALWAASRFGGQALASTSLYAAWIAAVTLGFFPLIEAFSPVPQAGVDVLKYSESLTRLAALDEGDMPRADAFVPHPPFDISFDAVTYQHKQSQQAALCDISLTIPYGLRVAVLGRSGAGKTTLCALLCGQLAPQKGSVTIGGAHPSRDAQAVTRFVGLIEQNPYVFNASIAENLRIAKPEATDEELYAALAAVGMKEFVASLPAGLYTQAHEAGTRFSGGQRQRIACARVLLRDTPIVVLDEPTVGLDPITERAVLDALFGALAGRTIIMVTHHLQGVSHMDEVIFLEEGRVKLQGSPQTLEETSAYYRTLLALDRGL